jgi:NAD(P)-dependent dehydrogenase (short-subunit alcohol dehydrogenase family)
VDPSRLDGKIAVVTGSTSGIGLGIARRLGELGAKVVVNSRSDERAEQTAATLAREGISVIGAGGDVSTPQGVAKLFDRTLGVYGTVDILVNNAGTIVRLPAEELSFEDWERILAVNLTGPFLCAQAAGRVMLAKGGGVIVNISSMLSHVSLPGRVAYQASKRGLDAVSESLGIEWGRRGIRVVSINPGWVGTPLIDAALRAGKLKLNDLERRTPMGRIAHVEEIAGAVAFLASPAASFVNATTLLVDGGWAAYGGWT